MLGAFRHQPQGPEELTFLERVRKIMTRIIAPLVLALLAPFSGPFLSAAGAQTLDSFVVSDDDGYGVDSCTAGAETCSHAVATAWCVANGYERSMSVRPAQAADITGSISGPTRIAATDEAGGVVITCER